MATIKIPPFGTLDPSSVEEYYDAETNFNGNDIVIDLNFEAKSIDIKRLEIAKQFIENIRIHDLNNKKSIQNDFNDPKGETVRLYLMHHLEELGTDDLTDLIGAGTKSADHPKLLLNKLQLIRVGLYPDSKDQFAIFDYSIGRELTDYLLVLNTDENGNLVYMTTES